MGPAITFLPNPRNCGRGKIKAQGIVVMREWKIHDAQWSSM